MIKDDTAGVYRTHKSTFGRALTLAGLPALLALAACGSPADNPDPAATTMDPYPVDVMEDGMAPAPTDTAVSPVPMPVPVPPTIASPVPPAGVETGTATMRGPGTDAPATPPPAATP